MKNVDFSCNINPLGPPKGLFEKIDLEKLVSSYPDYTNQEAIESLSKHYALPEENLAIGGGSTGFFFTIPSALNIGTGIIIIPTFWEYEASLKHANKKSLYFKTYAEDEFQIDLEKLRRVLSTATKEKTNPALYICNPNNPTSTLMDSKAIVKLCNEFPKVNFIVDETYLLFRHDYDDLSLMKEASGRKNLIVITSFSKFFTIPGVRMGICCSSKRNINAIAKYQIPYGVNTLAQALIPNLLENGTFFRESRDFMENERRRVYKLSKENSHLFPYDPQANFMLVRLRGKDINSTDIVKYLQQNKLIVRDGSEFLGLGKQYIRFSIRGGEENDFLLKTLNDYCYFRTKPP